MSELLQIRGLEYRYGYKTALRDLNLELNSGEIGVVLGPNGAGKTTLLRALISRGPARGAVSFRGAKVESMPARRDYLARTAYLGHEPGLFFDLNARDNLIFFQELHRSRRASRDRIDELLELCGLFHRRLEPVRAYSRGMKQRLALARCLLHEPDILYLDEPLTGLDTAGQAVLVKILEDHQSRGGAALVVTHTDEPFQALLSRRLFLKGGRLVADIDRDRYTEAARTKVHEILYGAAANA